ncbi:MAG: hypothetical protein HW386_1761, partial [Gammaproteobacteria bacterium]|nr:hypothetical protein [Gammaproteobacteria bacterium]
MCELDILMNSESQDDFAIDMMAH